MAATITFSSGVAQVSGAYKSGTLGSGSTTTVVNLGGSGETVSTGDVGRLIAWVPSASNTGTTEVRRITAVSGNNVTVHDPFTSAPSAGQTWRISTTLEDLDAALTEVAKIGNFSYSIAGDLRLVSSAFVGVLDASFSVGPLASPGLSLATGTIFQMGLLWGGERSTSRETTNGGSLFVNHTTAVDISIFSTTNSVDLGGAVVNLYGSLVRSFNLGSATWMFMRMRGPTRIIGCVFAGPMGGRFYHPSSEWAFNEHTGNNNSTSAWSLGATFTRDIDSNVFWQNLACLKNFDSFGGTIKNCVFTTSNTFVFRLEGLAASTVRLIDCTTFTDSAISDAGSGTLEQRKTINYSFTDSLGAAVQDMRVRVANLAGVEQANVVSNASGVVPEIQALIYQLANNPPSSTFSVFTFAFRRYGFVFQAFSASVADPIKQRTIAQANSFVVAASAATALAVTNPTTANQIYDHSQATYSTSGYMQYAEAISTADGVTLNFACNVTINSSLTAVAYTPATPAIAVSALALGTFATFRLGASRTIDLAQAATYSAAWSIPATGIVTVSNGTTNLSAWSFTSGAQVNLRSGATAATVIVGVGQDLSITAGAGVTVEAARPTTVVQGFPTTANIHGVEPNPVLYVYDASNWALLTAFDSLDPEYSDGTFSIIPGDYSALLAAGGSIMVVGDAVGWRRTTATAITISNPQTIIDLTFEEYVNEKGEAFMGTASAATGLSYDNPNSRIELASASGGTGPGYKFAEVGYQFDLLTSTKAGGAFDLNLIRQITYISNDTYKRILIPGELKVTANATAETGPILEDFTLISLDGTDPRVHGLPSSAPGLIERPGVVINYQAPPTTVILEGGNQVDLSDSTLEEITSTIEGYVITGTRRVLGEVG